ncbi:hypothetical protein EV184_12957 [Sinorhizobium americanum]|uniref:Uncharacterized protein n=1 Tax=Sinorhizobium americanum TaxID=194963 RepID=A0A4R2B080_9HYPH|nr:hypothetical protein EV184_12957 [Sinorhizobium americanum]
MTTVSSEADVAKGSRGSWLPPSHRAATMEALVSARASSARRIAAFWASASRLIASSRRFSSAARSSSVKPLTSVSLPSYKSRRGRKPYPSLRRCPAICQLHWNTCIAALMAVRAIHLIWLWHASAASIRAASVAGLATRPGDAMSFKNTERTLLPPAARLPAHHRINALPATVHTGASPSLFVGEGPFL